MRGFYYEGGRIRWVEVDQKLVPRLRPDMTSAHAEQASFGYTRECSEAKHLSAPHYEYGFG